VARSKIPVTAATRLLKSNRVGFAPHLYDYVERGGTAASSAALHVEERTVIKTLVLEDDSAQPLLALMHGDAEVSTKTLARHLGVKSVRPCLPPVADKHSGYQVGGTSPFGTRRAMPTYVQSTILELPLIYINGGKRGFLVALDPRDLNRLIEYEALDFRAG